MTEGPGLETLAAAVGPVARRFVDAGHRVFLVGGVVRDLVLAGDGELDVARNDIDLTTDALPAEIKRLVSPLADAVWSQGERFGTIGATVDGRELEITTHRAEAYDPESRKPVVSFGHDLDEDLSRRDFTINAAAIELPSRELHDPFGGLADLEAKVLRTPLSPEVSFTDDPLRMMRAARFMARFGLTPSPELVAAAAALADRLAIVSVERVSDELERLLLVDDPGPGFEFLVGTGLLQGILPVYDEDRPAIALGAALAAAAGDPTVRRAGLLWPVRTEAGRALSRLRYSNAKRTDTVALLDATALGLSRGGDPPTVRRMAARVGVDGLPLVSALAVALADHDPAWAPGAASRLAASIDELARAEDLGDLGSPLSGADIMAILSIEPGQDVGRAERYLRECRLESGPLTRSDAEQILVSWWRQERGGDLSLP